MTQNQALDIMRLGKNVFLTGAAGCGKSFLVRKYVSYLRKHKVAVAVTASTGIAATQIDGRTIHSWAGIGIKNDLTDKEITKLYYNSKLLRRVRRAKVLVIDEISMLGANILDLVDRVCQKLRQSEEPFGGLQVILGGDFFQLPPISNRDTGKKAEFAFLSQAWKTGGFVVCYLEKQHRQTDDQYHHILSCIRQSRVSEAVLALLTSRSGKPILSVTKPTQLFTHNADVDAINAQELAALPSGSVRYAMRSHGDPKLVQHLKKHSLVPETLELKKGAVIMFVQNNQSQGYVNGTLGTVIGFDPDDNYPVVKTLAGREIAAKPGSWKVEDDDEVLAEIIQVPIRLAWAITVHKCQGMSLDAAEIDLSKAFAAGMGYVALSRVRTLNGITLGGLNELALKVNPDITRMDAELKEQSLKISAELKTLVPRKKKKIMQEFINRNTTRE